MQNERVATYEIKIAQFEGPFDLILYFIERDEINIYDIPISTLTKDFLSYIHQMQDLNIELASEFILVAASLMRIKAKMLLPRKELDEHGEEIDPRKELVQKLIEYKRYKAVVEDLKKSEEIRSKKYKRGNIKFETINIANSYSTEMDLESINLFKLLKVFNQVMDRMNDRMQEAVIHKIVQYPYTIEEETGFIKRLVNTRKTVSFERLFESCRDKIHAIYRFLSILDLVQRKHLQLTQGLGTNNFWLNGRNGDEVDD